MVEAMDRQQGRSFKITGRASYRPIERVTYRAWDAVAASPKEM